MNNFVRLFGGALGALIAIVLAGGAHIPPLDLSSIGAVVMLVLWVAAWVVIGFSILPYVTVLPARWLIGRVMTLTAGEFVSAAAGLIIGLVIGALIGVVFLKRALELIGAVRRAQREGEPLPRPLLHDPTDS